MTKQTDKWDGTFGKEYTDRNNVDLQEMRNKYMKNYGVKREQMNKEILSDLHFDKILEVGTNVGNQLLVLQHMGYKNLWGIEVSDYAFQEAKKKTLNMNLVKASAFDIPFKDKYFDLVFTSGVLIHISPDDINKALDEIYRVSRKYIWGFEYHSEEYDEVNYRGNKELLWKTDYASLFLKRFPNLELVKTKRYPYIEGKNVDCMYLLKKI